MRGACPRGCVSRVEGGGPGWAAGARLGPGGEGQEPGGVGGSGRRNGRSQTEGKDEKRRAPRRTEPGRTLEGGPAIGVRDSARRRLSPKPTALPLRPERVRLPDLPACGATGLGWKRVPERCKFGEPALFGKALG